MKSIKQILHSKALNIISVEPESFVLQALQLMSKYNIGALPVVHGLDLVGILSERDYARKIALQGRSSTDTLVKDIMTPSVVTVGFNHSVQDCMALMSTKHIRHLPVIDAGKLIGILSIGDLVKEVIEEQQFQISQLESYIKS